MPLLNRKNKARPKSIFVSNYNLYSEHTTTAPTPNSPTKVSSSPTASPKMPIKPEHRKMLTRKPVPLPSSASSSVSTSKSSPLDVNKPLPLLPTVSNRKSIKPSIQTLQNFELPAPGALMTSHIATLNTSGYKTSEYLRRSFLDPRPAPPVPSHPPRFPSPPLPAPLQAGTRSSWGSATSGASIPAAGTVPPAEPWLESKRASQALQHHDLPAFMLEVGEALRDQSATVPVDSFERKLRSRSARVLRIQLDEERALREAEYRVDSVAGGQEGEGDQESSFWDSESEHGRQV